MAELNFSSCGLEWEWLRASGVAFCKPRVNKAAAAEPCQIFINIVLICAFQWKIKIEQGQNILNKKKVKQYLLRRNITRYNNKGHTGTVTLFVYGFNV